MSNTGIQTQLFQEAGSNRPKQTLYRFSLHRRINRVTETNPYHWLMAPFYDSYWVRILRSKGWDPQPTAIRNMYDVEEQNYSHYRMQWEHYHDLEGLIEDEIRLISWAEGITEEKAKAASPWIQELLQIQQS